MICAFRIEEYGVTGFGFLFNTIRHEARYIGVMPGGNGKREKKETENGKEVIHVGRCS